MPRLRTGKAPKSRTRNNIDIVMPSDAELKQMFDAVPILVRYDVLDKTLRAGAKPIVQRARALTPRSTPEDREKRSKSQKAKADWDYPLYKTIKYVVRKYNNKLGLAVIGPEWPKGNKAYVFTSSNGRRIWYWGVDQGFTKPPVTNWIKQAFDEKNNEALTAMKTKLKQLMREIWE